MSIQAAPRAVRWLAVAACFGPVAALAQDAVATTFTPEQIGAGAKLYEEHCAVCHGPRMVEPGGGFFDLRTFPSNQRRRFFDSVGNGKKSMPPWRNVLTEEQIGFLFAYVAAGEKK